jgi:hypothetical protein
MTHTFEFNCKCLPLLVCDHCMSTVWIGEVEARENLKQIMREEKEFLDQLHAKYGENYD